MRCFVHSDREAVGVCGACMRGVCGECANETGRLLACKGRCENEVRRISDLRDFAFTTPSTQKAVLNQAQRTRLLSALFYLVLGAAFLVYNLARPTDRLLTLMGALFAVMGAATLLLSLKKAVKDQFRLCAHCGYNVTGNTTGRCPECNHFV